MAKYIAILGDMPNSHTGFAKITDHLVESVILAGFNPIVIGRKNSVGIYNKCEIFSATKYGDVNGKKALLHVMDTYKPIMIITIGDPWENDFMPEIKQLYNVLWMYYVPVETSQTARFFMVSGNPVLYLDVGSLLSKADQLVAYSKTGSTALYNMFQTEYLLTNKDYKINEIPYVYHGVDIDKYKPVSEEIKKTYKQLLFPSIGFDTDKLFLFTCIKANSFRVGFDTLIEAWSLFMKSTSVQAMLYTGKKIPRLYIHTHLNGNGYQLPSLINIHGVSDSVILDKNIKFGIGVSEDKMHAIYSATDISINAVRGEGFGLPQLEAMAMGIPGIYPLCGTPPEIISSAARFISIASTYNPDFAPINFSIPKIDQMVTAMTELFIADHLRKKMGDVGVSLAKKYTWDNFHLYFKKIIMNLADQYVEKKIYIGYDSI